MDRYGLFMHHDWWKFKTVNDLKPRSGQVVFASSTVRSGVISKVMRYTSS